MPDRTNIVTKLVRWLAILLAICGPLWADAQEENRDPRERTRRNKGNIQSPVAAVSLDQGRQLAVAMSRSGQLLFVDVASGQIQQELPVAEQLAGLAGPTRAGLLLAIDDARDELIAVQRVEGRWRVLGRQSVVASPYSVVVDSSGEFACVAGLWSHRWQAVPLADWHRLSAAVGDSSDRDESPSRVTPRSPTTRPPIELPFPPGLQCALPEGRVIVADAFGGQLAVIDVARNQLVDVAALPIQNIGGLALSPDSARLAFVHQSLDPRLPITRDAIISGRLCRNEWSEIDIESLSAPAASWNTARTTRRLDEVAASPTAGVGDPRGIYWGEKYRVVAASGLNQLLIMDHLVQGRGTRMPVGVLPMVVVSLKADGLLAVLNSLDDSMSIVDPTGGVASRVIRLTPASSLSPAERGERLFFDASLSAGGFLSCHSCHVRGHTTSSLADTSGDGAFGAPKRTPTLLGTGFTYRWGWNGLQASLHDQSLQSFRTTMHSDRATFQQASDLVAYLHTLAPPPPVAPHAADDNDRRLLERGARVFESRRCGECHIPPLVYASHESYDVGLVDERGLKKFNPPSLRGVSQLSRWLHDGRATSLEAIFRDHLHPNDSTFHEEELAALVRYLRSL